MAKSVKRDGFSGRGEVVDADIPHLSFERGIGKAFTKGVDFASKNWLCGVVYTAREVGGEWCFLAAMNLMSNSVKSCAMFMLLASCFVFRLYFDLLDTRY